MHSRSRSWLVVILLACNLAVGVVSLFFLRSVNTRYAALFENGIPVINNLRTLTREVAAVQRLARLASEPADEAAWKQMLAQMETAGDRVQVHAADIGAAQLWQGTRYAELIPQLGHDYNAQVEEYLRIARVERQAGALRFNNEVLRPLADKVQLNLDETSAYVEQQGNNLRDHYTQDSRYFGGLLLAFAGWPVLAAALGVLVLALLIFALFITIFTPEIGWRDRRAPPS